jgi:hypothetical protein
MSDEQNQNAAKTDHDTNEPNNEAAAAQAPLDENTNAVPQNAAPKQEAAIDDNTNADPQMAQEAPEQLDPVEMQGPSRLASAILSYKQSSELKKEYRSLLEEQKALRAQSKQQGMGNKAGSGFMRLVNEQGQKDERVFARVRRNIFGEIAQDETDAQRIENLRKKEQELKAEGKTREEQQDELAKMPSRQMSDCYAGFMLTTSFMGGSALGVLIDDGSQQKQEVYDNGKGVKVAPHGPFNATSALFMAKTFMENRLIEPVQDAEGNISLQKKESISVHINAKGDLKSKVGLGGVSTQEKEALLVIANLHQANRFGVKLDLTINGTQVDLEKYAEQNRGALEAAIQKTNDKLDMIGQDPIESLDSLIQKQTNEFAVDQDIELTDPSADEPQPEAAPDTAQEQAQEDVNPDDTAQEQAQTQEEINPEDAALEAQLDGEDASAGAPEPPSTTKVPHGEIIPADAVTPVDEQAAVNSVKNVPASTELNVGNKHGEVAGSNVPSVPGEQVAKQIEHEQQKALPAPTPPSRDSLEGPKDKPETPKQLPPPRSPGMGNGAR